MCKQWNFDFAFWISRLRNRVFGATTLWWAVLTVATSSSGTDTLRSTSCSSKQTTTWSTVCSHTPTTPVRPGSTFAQNRRFHFLVRIDARWHPVCFLLRFSSCFFRDRLRHQDLVTAGSVSIFQQSSCPWGKHAVRPTENCDHSEVRAVS